MTDWLQRSLPYDPSALPHMRRLPGTAPLGDAPWLIRDEGFAGQMRLRDALLATRRADVVAAVPGSEPALAELLEAVLHDLARAPGFDIAEGRIRRPDGIEVPRDLPVLDQLARLVQEDLCVMEAGPQGHVLTAATLLFPANWTLAEKIGRPLDLIHRIVPRYDPEVARRVQRFFDALRPEAPIWRFNLHGQAEPVLFAPAREVDPKPTRTGIPAYLRSERQVLRRLPRTGAVVFSIHSYLVARQDLPEAVCALVDGTPFRGAVS